MQELSMRNYAHIGDAVWELFVREYTVYKTQNSKQLHNMTTERVKAGFQAKYLDLIQHEFVVKQTIQKLKNTSLKDLVHLKEMLTDAEYKIKSGASIDIISEVENAIIR